MTTDERKVTVLGETTTVPEDPRFRIWRDGTCDFRISLGRMTYGCSLKSDHFGGVLALSACEAAIVHFEGKARAFRRMADGPPPGGSTAYDVGHYLEQQYACEELAEAWRRILEKVRERP